MATTPDIAVAAPAVQAAGASRTAMLRSPLFWRFMVPIIAVVLLFTGAIYTFSVPYLKKLVYSMEERAVLTNLNNVHELVRANSLAIDAYKQSVLAAHKEQLKNITLFEAAFIKSKYDEVQQGLLTEDEAKAAVLDELKRFRYGNDNYVWVADLAGVFLSHPDPEMDQHDFSERQDVFGNYVLTPLIDKVLEANEGYHSYWWQRLGQDLPAEQLTYGRLFAPWGWVIGTGVYLDDLETQVILRKEKMIEELRSILLPIRVANTGYFYIFDSWKNIIIHPDEKRENTNMAEVKNPATGRSLADELMAASRTAAQRFSYLWDRPDDPGNFRYEKIDWVKYVDGFDWYIVASVYTDELNASSMALRNRILVVSAAIFVVTAMVISLLVGRLLRPIKALTHTAVQVQEGDLTARCHVAQKDEIGFLAASFNAMVAELRQNIEELDQKVLERTRELDEKNRRLEDEVEERQRAQEALSQANARLQDNISRLEQHNREIQLLNRMGEALQACHSLEDTYPVVRTILAELFPGVAGALYMIREEDGKLAKEAAWNSFPESFELFAADDCWSLRRGRPHLAAMPEQGQLCRHVGVAGDQLVSLCLPLAGQNEVLGVLHLRYLRARAADDRGERHQVENLQRLGVTVADHLAMAQANLRLRERLHRLSVRDGLTGLFNRRYMEETLLREFKRSQRQQTPVGVIILDVDFFKKFNDTYGHEAGDVVLKSLARHMEARVRQGDVVCRYGGEEFVIIMPGSNLEHTVERAEAIRASVAEEMRPTYGDNTFTVTISMGAAEYPTHGATPEAVLAAADGALYRSKEMGRNRVTAAS